MDARKLEIIDKIMKLLNLGDETRNSNPHERDLAAKKAAQLMAEYSIDFIDLKEGKAKSYSFMKEEVQGYGFHENTWEAILASGVARIMDCKVITRDWRHEEGWYIIFVGTKSDIELAVFFFKYLRRTINRMAEVSSTKKASRDSYCYGMILTIKQRLEELFRQKEELIPSNCRDLVIIKKDDLNEAFKEMFPNTRRSHLRTSNKDYHAYVKGLEDGKNIPLNRPLPNGGAVGQIA